MADLLFLKCQEVSEFTPSTSALIVDKLVDLEPAMFAWMFRLMCIKPYLDALGAAHGLEACLVKIRVNSALFVASVHVRLPVSRCLHCRTPSSSDIVGVVISGLSAR
jgi:hypothetical protein